MLARGVSRAAARTVHAPIRSHACQLRFVSGSQLGRKLGSSKGLAGLAGAALLFAVGGSTSLQAPNRTDTSFLVPCHSIRFRTEAFNRLYFL
jgi:hypothetical protein